MRPDLVVQLASPGAPETSAVMALSDANFGDLAPVEYGADLVVVLGPPDAPTRVFVVEVQLRKDADKPYAWLFYLAATRLRWRRPVTIVVVTPDRAVATWAARPIEVDGCGAVVAPVVLGPDQIPPLSDPAVAAASPHLAVLSALTHPPGAEGAEVLAVALEAAARLDPAQGAFYYDLVLSRLDDAARAALEAFMQQQEHKYVSDFARKYFAEGRVEGKAEGKAEGEALAVLRILKARGLYPTVAQEAQILGTTEPARLERWLDRVIDASSVDALLSDR